MTTATHQTHHTKTYEYVGTDPADTEQSALEYQRAILHLARIDSCACEVHQLMPGKSQ